MRYDAVISGRNVSIEKLDESRFRIGDKECDVSVEVLETGIYSILLNGTSYEVSVREEKKNFLVEVGPHLIPVKLEDPFKAKSATGGEAIEGEALISSPMPGRIVGVKATVGQEVKEGDGVIVVEAMKMENELHAPKSGKIKVLHVKVGDAVEGGQDLVVIE